MTSNTGVAVSQLTAAFYKRSLVWEGTNSQGPTGGEESAYIEAVDLILPLMYVS